MIIAIKYLNSRHLKLGLVSTLGLGRGCLRRTDLTDSDHNLFGGDGRLERIMTGVSQNQLKGVLAGWEINAGLGLACAEMQVRLVLRNRLIRVQLFTHINQQMVVTAVWKAIPRMGHAHVA